MAVDRLPPPLESVMAQVPQQRAVPRDNEIERSLVLHRRGARSAKKIPLCRFSLPIPFILAGKAPNGVGSAPRTAVFFYQACSNRAAHFVVDRGCVFASQAE